MDEPFNGLDPTKRTLLANRIKEVKKQGGTILISTHILSDLQELADEITGTIVHLKIYDNFRASELPRTVIFVRKLVLSTFCFGKLVTNQETQGVAKMVA
ncbi:11651_t:CDS:2, partial [Gigaspora margarita]